MRFSFLAALLLWPVAAVAQDAAPPPADIPFFPGVETVHSLGHDWFPAGSNPRDYQMGFVATEGTLGQEALVIKARPGVGTSGFGTMMQMHPPGEFLGKRVRLSARMKTEGVRTAQLWMRVDGKSRSAPLEFYNMDDRPVRGTTGWTRYQIVLDVASDAVAVAYGFFVSGGRGTAWMDDVNLEIVGRDVPVSD